MKERQQHAEMMRIVKEPAAMQAKILDNILKSARISFDEEVAVSGSPHADQGYINAKDFQIMCLFEYEKLRTKPTKKKRMHSKNASHLTPSSSNPTLGVK